MALDDGVGRLAFLVNKCDSFSWKINLTHIFMKVAQFLMGLAERLPSNAYPRR